MKIVVGRARRSRRVQGWRVRISVTQAGRHHALRVGFSAETANALGLSLGSHVQAGADEQGRFCLRKTMSEDEAARKVGGTEGLLHVVFDAAIFGLAQNSSRKEFAAQRLDYEGQPLLIVPTFRVSVVQPTGGN